MNWLAFLIFTLCIAGWSAWMMGKALSATWRPWLLVLFYSLLLGAADRFIHYALFEGTLLSLGYYLLDTAVLLAIASVAYRVTQVTKMIQQYPWLYRRSSPITWVAIDPSNSSASSLADTGKQE